MIPFQIHGCKYTAHKISFIAWSKNSLRAAICPRPFGCLASCNNHAWWNSRLSSALFELHFCECSLLYQQQVPWSAQSKAKRKTAKGQLKQK